MRHYSPHSNYVIWSAHLGFPGYTGRNSAEPAEIKTYYVITRNLNAQKHLWPFNQDGDSRRDNKHKRLKGTTEGQKLMLTFAAIAKQMERNCIKGALALLCHFDAMVTQIDLTW